MRTETYEKLYAALQVAVADKTITVDELQPILQMLPNLGTIKRDIKCQYCSAIVKDVTAVPDGWVTCRLRTDAPDGVPIANYIQGPRACPEHARQIGNIFKEYANKE